MWTLILNLILAAVMHGANGQAWHDGADIIGPKAEAPAVEIAAGKGAVMSADGRTFFYRRAADDKQPIASITKLMTALVFLDNNPGWETTYTITSSDQIAGGRLNLFPGEIVRIKDLFYTSLVASDNGATQALVHATGLSTEEFVGKMNEKARTLHLGQTSFVDPVGLSDDNLSTASDVARLAKTAFGRDEIMQATESREYSFTTLDGREKKIESTDYLLFDPQDNPFEVLGGKTGYTDRAGYCFVGRFRDGATGREIISVVLDSGGKNERFRESKTLVNWVFDNYAWR